MDSIEVPFQENFIPIFIYELEDLSIKEVNEAALELYGYTRKEMLSMTIKDLRRSSEIPKFIDALSESKVSPNFAKNSGVWEHIDKKGNAIYVRVVFSPTIFEGENCRVVFIQDVTKEQKLNEKLRTEMKILEKILNKLPGSFYIINKQGEILRWNNKMEEITGYSAEEIRSLHVSSLFPKSELPKATEAINQVFSSGFAEMESVTKTKNGEEIPFYFVASSIRYRGQDCLIGISLDISEIVEYENQLEESLKEKETLLSEIHHRVKNNLAIVSSLMQLQSMESENEEVQQVLLESQNRVKSIALTHEQLYKEESFSRINFTKNIHRLIENIKNTFSTSSNFELELDDVHLNINKALPSSLLINELITHILHHSAGYYQHDTIKISLKDKGEHIHLTIKNKKGKPSEEYSNLQQSDTLGLQLTTVLAKQIKAETKQYFDDGIVYEFQFANEDIKGVGNASL